MELSSDGWFAGQELTPVMTHHARLRCAQMGISTKVAKRIWRKRTLVRGGDNGKVVTSAEVPGYAIVVKAIGGDGAPVVMTVLFHVEQTYVREGAGYRVVS